jgi:hypothetical protein
MLPDVHRETMTGWAVLAGTVLVVGLTVWLLWDGGTSAEQVAQARAAGGEQNGKEEMRTRVERQREANQALRATIERLKKDCEFDIEERYRIPDSEKQPGYLFKKRFVEVRQALREKAEPKRIVYDENIGFGSDAQVPDDREAPYLMTMLQLTEKLVALAIAAPEPLESFTVSHGPAVDTGPESRPVLLREYPLELKVRGTLKDILWILHRISQVDPTGPDGRKRDYPLILRGLSIQGDDLAHKDPTGKSGVRFRDDIAQHEAVFQLAGMQFVSEKERASDPQYLRSHPANAGVSAGGSSASSAFEARP